MTFNIKRSLNKKFFIYMHDDYLTKGDTIKMQSNESVTVVVLRTYRKHWWHRIGIGTYTKGKVKVKTL
jgi:hypothetical protein